MSASLGGATRSLQRPRQGPIAILSIQHAVLGHRTYFRVLNQHFANSDRCRLVPLVRGADADLPRGLRPPRLAGGSAAPVFGTMLASYRAARQLQHAFETRLAVTRSLARRPFDVLHFHTQIEALLCTGLMRRTPTVVSTDQTLVQIAARTPQTARALRFSQLLRLEQRVYDAAAAVVFFSEWARAAALKECGLAPEKAVRIYPGVDISRIPDSSEMRRPRAGRPRILLIADDLPLKGAPDLIDVFLRCFADMAELHLATRGVVGVTHPDIHVHRGIDPYTPRWLELYRAADIFVMPTYRDAFGHTLVEAMAAGLPVISTQINAIPEIVRDGETGFLIAPGDRAALAQRLALLLANAERRSAMGACGRAIAVSTFDARKNAETLEQVLLTAVGRNPEHA